jgi:hypothetical protein
MNTEENDTEAELAAWELLREARLELTAVTEQRDRLAAYRDEFEEVAEIAIDILAGNHPVIDWRDAGQSELLRELCQYLEENAPLSALDDAREENIGWKNKWQVAVEMAALAENKLTAVTEQRDGLHELHNKNAARSKELLELCGKLRKELTAVTEQRDAVTLRLGNTQERMFDAEMQREKLIKAIEPLEYWRDISECDCSNPLPQGGCLRCDLERILKITNPNEQ